MSSMYPKSLLFCCHGQFQIVSFLVTYDTLQWDTSRAYGRTRHRPCSASSGLELISNPARSRRIAGDLVDAEIREGCTAAASHLPIFVNGPWKTSSEAQAIRRTCSPNPTRQERQQVDPPFRPTWHTCPVYKNPRAPPRKGLHAADLDPKVHATTTILSLPRRRRAGGETAPLCRTWR